jgi:glycerol uptake facilitator-like aquaporin
MVYSLGNKFIAECMAMCFAIFLGTSVIANELLPNTKGHGMGYFGTALGFSFAFVIPGTFFGPISAEMNPAMFFYLALRGKLDYGYTEFVVGSCTDLLGAFIGACLTYFYWAYHFWTTPLPQDPDPVSRLIHGPPDALSNDAGRLASAFGTDSRAQEGKSLIHELSSFGDKLVQGTRTDLSHLEMEPLDEDKEYEDGNSSENRKTSARRLRSSSLSSDSQRRAVHDSSESRLRSGSNVSERRMRSGSTASERRLRSTSVDVVMEQLEAERQHRSAFSADGTFYSQMNLMDLPPYDNTSTFYDSTTTHEHPEVPEVPTESTPIIDNKDQSKFNKLRFKLPRVSLPKRPFFHSKKAAEEMRDAAFEAAIRADQSAKLSIFATRPARFNRVTNFLQEMTATFFLIFGIHMLNLRLEHNSDDELSTGPYTQSILVSFYVVSLVLGLGGTTGFAVNPARDLGPRIAHALLPIPGKGGSEWEYGWVPVIAPFCGAAIAAGVMSWMEIMYASNTD